jgi:hypothetical protein
VSAASAAADSHPSRATSVHLAGGGRRSREMFAGCFEEMQSSAISACSCILCCEQLVYVLQSSMPWLQLQLLVLCYNAYAAAAAAVAAAVGACSASAGLVCRFAACGALL